MLYCDSHIEFIHPLEDCKKSDKNFSNSQVNPRMISKVKPELVFLATCVFPGENAWHKMIKNVNLYLSAVKSNGWILVKSAGDLKRHGIKVILHIEDLTAISDQLDRIQTLYDLGIRSIGLTHNLANQFGGGSLSNKRLTKLGKDAIKKILKLNIILDLAHLNTKTFFDIMNNFDIKPFVSHAGIFSCYPNKRNVKDEILDAARKKKGYIGIGFAGSFLGEKTATIRQVEEQINYAVKIAGRNRVGIGSDLGGIISFLPSGLSNFTKTKNLSIQPDILGKNLLKFLNER